MGSNDIAIKVENISKRYRIGLKEEIHDSFASAIFDFVKSPLKNYRKHRSLYKFDDVKSGYDQDSNTNPSGIIWALNDISFEIKQGEVLGIIGSNGAGKSTLLKILCRITDPTSGRAEIRGKVSSLLEVGTGFHPELTGIENIYLNGTILGMTKKEVDTKFSEIVEFSGVEKFINTPVKRYSSGMKVRLAFSVAAHLEPEILIVDEVLAVGDLAFQKKCLGKMSEVSRQGRTVLLVSHNMTAIEHLCTRVILLESGKVKVDTDPNKAIKEYLKSFSKTSTTHEMGLERRKYDLRPVIQKVEFLNIHKQPVSAVPVGAHLTVYIHYRHSESIKDPYFGLTFETSAGVKVVWVETRLQKGLLPDLPPAGIVACHIARLPLLPGKYFISPGCGSRITQLDYITRGYELQITEADFFGTGRLPNSSQALVLVDADWEVKLRSAACNQRISQRASHQISSFINHRFPSK